MSGRDYSVSTRGQPSSSSPPLITFFGWRPLRNGKSRCTYCIAFVHVQVCVIIIKLGKLNFCNMKSYWPDGDELQQQHIIKKRLDSEYQFVGPFNALTAGQFDFTFAQSKPWRCAVFLCCFNAFKLFTPKRSMNSMSGKYRMIGGHSRRFIQYSNAFCSSPVHLLATECPHQKSSRHNVNVECSAIV